MKRLPILFGILMLIQACQDARQSDLIITNAMVATLDEKNPTANTVVIADDRIQAVGEADLIEEWKSDETQILDVQGAFVMPGFIEAHGHFSGLGSSLQNLNFLRARSWEEIVAMVGEKVQETEEGEWIIGRGWHQEKWVRVPEENLHGYPYHDELSEVSPHNPVLLVHASGHGSFANKAAMDVAGVTRETPSPSGGEIVRDSRGDAIGMFEERAQGLIRRAYQEYLKSLSEPVKLEQWYEGVELAQQECLENGITSFQDAGSSFTWLERFRGLAEEGKFDIRLWAMIRHSSAHMEGKLSDFPWIGLGNNFFTVRAIKSEVDGALGAFGAWLHEPYADKPDFYGQNTTEVSEVAKIADQALAHDLQLCVHAIGDRANTEVLDIFEQASEKSDNKDLRWRVEHAQHLSTSDIPRFKTIGAIASMQGIHCTSDAPYVEKRLGYQRSKEGAYPWRSLLDAGAIICNGTDAPVEDVNPIESFYASVTRKRIDNGFSFFPEQAMTRHEALKSYTLDAAYAAFEEDLKGSLESGKLADITILSKDLLNCTDEEILEAQVLYTIVGGEIKYHAQ